MLHCCSVVSYSTGSKVLHWLIALFVISMLSFGFLLSGLPEEQKKSAYMLHKSFGLTILMLMGLRLFWIGYYGRPALPATVPFWERILSRSVQYALYVLLVAMPLSGWVMSVASGKIPQYFNLVAVPLPIQPDKALAGAAWLVHSTIAWLLIGLITLHIAGALKHYFWDRDQVLQSMLKSKK